MGNHIKFLIQSLLSYENDFNSRLDLLTSIGIDSTNEKIFSACEEIRNELPDSDQEITVKRDDVLRSAVSEENLCNPRCFESEEILFGEQT